MADEGHMRGPWEWYTRTHCEGLAFSHESYVGPSDGNDNCGPLAAVYGDDHEQSAANARRIAACLNACEGIPTAAIEDEDDVVKGLLEACRWLLREVMGQPVAIPYEVFEAIEAIEVEVKRATTPIPTEAGR